MYLNATPGAGWNGEKANSYGEFIPLSLSGQFDKKNVVV